MILPEETLFYISKVFILMLCFVNDIKAILLAIEPQNIFDMIDH